MSSNYIYLIVVRLIFSYCFKDSECIVRRYIAAEKPHSGILKGNYLTVNNDIHAIDNGTQIGRQIMQIFAHIYL